MHLSSARVALFAALATTMSACGSRSALDPGDAGAPPAGECLLDADCDDADLCHPRACVARKCVARAGPSCDDGDVCTTDACDPHTGHCVFTPRALDRDGDGVKGPAPGQSWRDATACGHDCDDTDPRAFPGNPEVCDGVDNDCNGIVDDGAIYLPVSGTLPVLVSDASLPIATATSLARAPGVAGYLASYTAQGLDGHTKVTVRRLGEDGVGLASGQAINLTLGDAEGGPLVWTGDRYGLAWSDRRTGDYEIWFSPLDKEGNKLGPDARVSFATGFSISPSLGWDGTSFYVVWQDRRAGTFAIWGRRIDDLGAPLGEETLLAAEDEAEAPSIAVSSSTLAVLYRRGGPTAGTIALRTFQPGLTAPSPPLVLAKDGPYAEPSLIVQGADLFATWVAAGQQHRVHGALLSSAGAAKIGPIELALPAGETRAPRALGLGDRIVLVYGHVSAGTGYDVWTSTLGANLASLGPPQPMTAASGDELPEGVAFGAGGDVAAVLTGRIPATGKGFKPAAEFGHLACSGLVKGP